MISSVTYTNSDNTMVLVQPGNQNVTWPPEPHSFGVVVQDWLEEGNSITPYAQSLREVKGNKLEELKQAFITEAYAPVPALNATWNGGSDSAMLLNGKAETLLHLGETKGSIHDIDNKPHLLSVNDIKNIAATISIAFEAPFVKYQAKKSEVADCGDDSTCIANVTW